ncbi:uncharacterized protein [Triticum aestivum]|uniref:uncharacterized protein n=1 Tax=Triticum aestivum TaxID=4565 RepID=UPI001D028AEC|nr:uncharacterized protein LOC123130883 [Triticum aestivum]
MVPPYQQTNSNSNSGLTMTTTHRAGDAVNNRPIVPPSGEPNSGPTSSLIITATHRAGDAGGVSNAGPASSLTMTAVHRARGAVPGSSPISGEAEESNAADISRTSSLHPGTRSHGQVRSPTSNTAIVVVPTASQTDEGAATWEELGLGNIMGDDILDYGPAASNTRLEFPTDEQAATWEEPGLGNIMGDGIPDYGLAASNTRLEFPDDETSLANITFTPDGSPFGL